MEKIIKGGFLARHRNVVLGAAGIISALGTYLVGDEDIFITLQAIFAVCGIYFLRKSNKDKGCSNGKNSGKISD